MIVTLLKLIEDQTLKDGEIILDKDKGIILYKNIDDWFQFMREYNAIDSSDI
jgi:hypothetical protein